MLVTLELTGPDLPADHPQAPWKTGEKRALYVSMAEALQRERVGHFRIVDDAAPKPKKAAAAGGND